MFKCLSHLSLLLLVVDLGGTFGIAQASSPTQVDKVEVSGDKEALVSFETSGTVIPTVKIEGNIVEMTFPNSELGAQVKEKSELSSPHSLISRVSLYAADKNAVRARVVIKGSVDALKERIHLVRDGEWVRLKIDYPKGFGTTAQLLEEEQLPIAILSPTAKPIPEAPGKWQYLLIVLVFGLAGLATYFFAKFLSQRGKVRGTRKYLIEQLSYCPVGNKSGVALLKIGNEFALVGITNQSITMLSSLPKLQIQYEGEAKLERDDFKSAVDDEYRRMTPSNKLPRVSA